LRFHTTVHFVGLSVIVVSRESVGGIDTKLRTGRSGIRMPAIERSFYLNENRTDLF
jgi:hypothetical protein